MRLTVLALAILPVAAFAAGTETETPPTPTETTEVCEEGLVWDLATQSCLSPEDSTNNDQSRLNDVRELAYAGYYQAAIDVLDTLDDPQSPMALTYYGFANRKAGRIDVGMAYYDAALQADPDNLLARSYMGQGYVASGQIQMAYAQLTEIRTRGGQGTWPETSLADAIRTGVTYSY